MPRLAHVVIVVMENRDSAQILRNPDAPFLIRLATEGLSLTDMRGETHPSQPNYLALFSGSTQGVTSDACPSPFDRPNLATELISAGYSFTGYSVGLPEPGYRGCTAGRYVRKHNPWADFTNVPDASNQPFTAFPTDFTQLPTISFVIPDLNHDMHDGTIAEGDAWLAAHLGAYVTWASSHRSLLIVTWDENDGRPGNQIATILAGAGVKPGTDSQPVNHYSLLRSLEDAYGLAALGQSAPARPIVGVWQPS